MLKKHQNYVVQAYTSRTEQSVESSIHATAPDMGQVTPLLTDPNAANILYLGCGGGHIRLQHPLGAQCYCV